MLELGCWCRCSAAAVCAWELARRVLLQGAAAGRRCCVSLGAGAAAGCAGELVCCAVAAWVLVRCGMQTVGTRVECILRRHVDW